MQKFNYYVEVEVNSQWVHAHVKTLAEAKALLEALEAVDATKACLFDEGIYLNEEDATDEARAEYKQYIQECMAETEAWLKAQVAEGKMTVENGVYKGRLVDLA